MNLFASHYAWGLTFEITFQIEKYISIARGLSSDETFKCSDIEVFQVETESVTETNISHWKEMNENINGTRSETCCIWRFPNRA